MVATLQMDRCGFTELSHNDLANVNGGLPVLFVIWGIKVTVGMCIKAGVALGLTAGGAVVLSN